MDESNFPDESGDHQRDIFTEENKCRLDRIDSYYIITKINTF